MVNTDAKTTMTITELIDRHEQRLHSTHSRQDRLLNWRNHTPWRDWCTRTKLRHLIERHDDLIYKLENRLRVLVDHHPHLYRRFPAETHPITAQLYQENQSRTPKYL